MRKINSTNQTSNIISDDSKQLQVIMSDCSKILVEAPAGYGKTYTMISMISYWFKNDYIPANKRVLCLSYTTAAANRMKTSIKENMINFNMPYNSTINITTTNFHGFCRLVLRKYGHLVGVANIDSLESINIDDLKNNSSMEFKIVQSLENEIKSGTLTIKNLTSKIGSYVLSEKKLLRSQNKISYSAIIITVLYLFQKYPAIKHGYQQYFRAICIDEFQDTNILGLALIEKLITKNNKLAAFGDPMQQIYSFQGAIPGLFDKLLTEYTDILYFRLTKNYRFSNNSSMLKLDNAIHKFYNNPQNFSLSNPIKIHPIHGITLSDQALLISNKIKSIQKKDPDSSIAILFNQVSTNTRILKSELSKNINFLDATFKTTDKEFLDFENLVLTLYQAKFKDYPINKSQVKSFMKLVKDNSCKINSQFRYSFLPLLNAFLETSISKIPSELRSEYITEILVSESLRQSIPDVSEKVILSTIHGAKGLEWDYVVIANFQNGDFPNYYDFKNLKIDSNNLPTNLKAIDSNDIIKIMNKFYVAFSRAKKDILFSYSEFGVKPWGDEYKTQLSILSTLPIFDFKL